MKYDTVECRYWKLYTRNAVRNEKTTAVDSDEKLTFYRAKQERKEGTNFFHPIKSLGLVKAGLKGVSSEEGCDKGVI